MNSSQERSQALQRIENLILEEEMQCGSDAFLRREFSDLRQRAVMIRGYFLAEQDKETPKNET